MYRTWLAYFRPDPLDRRPFSAQPAKVLSPALASVRRAPADLHNFQTDMPGHDRKLDRDEMGRPSPSAHLVGPKFPIRLVLDDVRSRHNVGSIFRTADSFGAEGIVLCGFTPHPPHREIEKTALGATLSVPWTSAANALLAVTDLKDMGYRVIAVEQTLHAVPLQELAIDAPSPLALVFGNELEGVSAPVVAACDGTVIIPQHGSKHSLNVSVCAGVVLWWCTQAHQKQLFPGIPYKGNP